MPVAIAVVVSIVLTTLITAVVFSKQVRGVLAGLLVYPAVWVAYASVRILPPIAGFFARTVLAAFQTLGPTMADVAAELMTEVTGEEVPKSDVARLRGSTSILDTGTILAERIVPQFLSALLPTAAVTPEAAREHSERLLGIGLSFALDSWSDHTILELSTLGQLSWAADVSEAIAEGLGLSRLTRRAVQAIYGRALQPGLEAHLNTVYRPERLRPAEAIDAWQQGLLDDNAVLRALAQEGYSFELATLLLNARQRDFTRSEVEQLWRLGVLDDGFIGRWTRRQGYGEERARLMDLLITSDRSVTLLGQIAAQGRRLFRLGQIDTGELRDILTQAGFRDQEIDLVLVQEELQGREERLLSKAEVLSAYREGALDAGEARDRLRLLRYPDPDIDVFLATQVKQLSVAQIIDALIRNIIPEATARQRLEAQGYRPADVDILLDLRVRGLTPGQVVDALTRGLIDPQAAQRLLEQAGFSRETADLFLSFQRRILSVADITAALLRGIIAEPEALNRLLSQGYSQQDASLLLQLRFQLLSAGEILNAYDAGLVGRASARFRLQVLGFSPEDSELLLSLFEAKRIREGRRPASGA